MVRALRRPAVFGRLSSRVRLALAANQQPHDQESVIARSATLPSPQIPSPQSVASDPPALRPATRADLPAIVEIIRSSASWYRPFVHPEDLDQHEVDLAWARENFDRRDFYVAALGGRVVGTVTLQDAGDFSYLGYVYVHADHTGKGLGPTLLRFAEAESVRRGDRGMVLLAHPKATWATKAYKRFGFEVTATTDEEVMRWNGGFLEPYHERGFHVFRYLHEAAA
ncbi:MAG: GNAT family N-acetyltransferase [Deltaproteobacteria bacterium]|nr:GNAT family N-acetyltransferase [Deltaproteobacteria bacterium]